ncbi:MAG TPA: tetratricopeptide repeat protein [bacterium]|nr:tetratricopeptide repeat protein [bacterium]
MRIPVTLALVGSFALAGTVLGQTARMDSQDALNVARSTAVDRARNGYLADALASSKNAVHLAEERLGPTHPSLCPYLLDNAALERTLGLYEEAEGSLQWCLALLQRNRRLEDPLYPQTLFSLCALYLDQGRPADALYWGQKGLEALEDAKGTGHDIQKIQGLELLAEAKKDLNDPTGALTLLVKARGLCGRLSPSDPKLEIGLLTALSRAQTLLKRFPEAQGSLEKALELARKLPEGSIELADTLESQGRLWEIRGAQEKARASYEAALSLYQKFVGSFFGYSILDYARKLERAYLSLGRFKEAEEIGNRTLKTCQDSYGTDNPRLALALMDLARAQKGAKEDKEAGDNVTEALRILRAKLQPGAPLVREAEDLSRSMGR